MEPSSIRMMRWSSVRRVSAIAILGITVVPAGISQASTPEESCQKGRYAAAAKNALCQQKALSKFFASAASVDASDRYQASAAKCRTKYAAVWPKLQTSASGTGTICDNVRFVDNGDQTVTDRLTGLVWEKKGSLDGIANLANQHDADNRYTWSGGPSSGENGTAFTSFLYPVNGGVGTAGSNGWRLPTILSGTYPCTPGTCIDGVFGPTTSDGYWSATTYAKDATQAWGVFFNTGNVFYVYSKGSGFCARAVRAGL